LTRDDKVDVFAHPVIAEIDLAEVGSTLQQWGISEDLGKRPDQSRQVEVLLNGPRLQARNCRGLSAKVF
jgi:hypothetical protein